MKILVTGASSRIGESLAAAFSPGNHLVLLGRDAARLAAVQARCIGCGAVQVETKAADIAHLSPEDWSELATDTAVVIHASFQHAGRRDDQLGPRELDEVMAANLIAPLRLFQAATNRADHPVCIILISSFLAKIRSPNRLIYGSLKLLQEEYLRTLSRDRPAVRTLLVKVAKVIPTDKASASAEALGNHVYRAYQSGKSQTTYGVLGDFLVTLFYMQPLVYFAVSAAQRWLRKRIIPAA